MATKKRPGSAKRTVARQEAARKRSAPGKRFVGETADQSAKAKRDERKKVARLARAAARKATRAEAAKTVGGAKKRSASANRGPGSAGDRAARTVARAGAAFRAAEAEAALRGAEIEPLETAARPTPDDPAAGTRDRPPLHLLEGAGERSTAEPSYEPSIDVSEDRSSAIGEASPPPLGWAVADLARSALGLVRTLVAVPFRIALAIPRLAIRAVASV